MRDKPVPHEQTELHFALSMNAILCITSGHEIRIEVPDTDLLIVLSADQQAVRFFTNARDRLVPPTPPSKALN